MPLIQRPLRRQAKETLSVRLEPQVKALLDEYCSFIACGRQHVVEQALLYTFEQDNEFQRWRERQRTYTTGAGA